LSTNPQTSAVPETRLGWLMVGPPMERATRVLAMLTGFSIPLSTSFSEITTGLFMLCWVSSGNLKSKWDAIRGNVVALVSLAMFGLLLAGMTWSVESWSAAGRCVLKYREFIYLPMFLVVFRDAWLRRISISAFMLAAIILQGLTYYEWLTGADFGIKSTTVDYVVAKDRIIHSLMMAFLVYLAATLFAEAGAISAGSSGLARWLYAGIMALSLYNILCMVQGRTGYVLLVALSALFLIERMGKRGVALAAVLLGVSIWCGLNFSSMISERVGLTVLQLENQFGPDRKHSPDPRMEFFANTAKLIRRHPFMGTGTGSFRSQYAKLVAGTDDKATSDPHNEYLHLATQLGIPGALFFALLLGVQWCAASRLRPPECYVGRAVVLTISVGSLFNSLILSITGGLIYAYFSGIAFAELSQPGQQELQLSPADGEAPMLMEQSPARKAA
jgi:O-antigen ligase